MELKQIIKDIIHRCPTSNKDIKIGVDKDWETCWIFSEGNDTWGWYNAYSKLIEEMLTANEFKWAYAFEMEANDYPYIVMFITKGNIKSKAERFIESVMPLEKVSLEFSSFKGVCESYNDAHKDALSQSIMGIASEVIEVFEV